MQHVINKKTCYALGGLDKKTQRKGGGCNTQRKTKNVAPWNFGHKKIEQRRVGATCIEKKTHFTFGGLDTKKQKGKGLGATHSRKKNMLCTWNFGHKKHRGRGCKCNTPKKKLYTLGALDIKT